MRLSARTRGGGGQRLLRRSLHAGFSLFEAVIAAALVLLIVTAVTTCVTTVSRTGGHEESAQRADSAVAAVAERLLGLPFCPETLPAPAAPRAAEAADLVAAVFPHALIWENTQDARFVPVDEAGVAAGSFVTRFVEDGLVVSCIAWFCDAVGSRTASDDVEGFDVRSSSSVPGPMLELSLTCGGESSVRTWRVVRRAGATHVVDGGEG